MPWQRGLPNWPPSMLVEMNDDKSPLIDLMNCIVCSRTMKLARSAPDEAGHDLIQYRCERCGRIEMLRLVRRGRPWCPAEAAASAR
jgi:hypothetical protein